MQGQGLNNPTSVSTPGIGTTVASEIVEPPRDQCGCRRTIRRGSTIPPADVFWVSTHRPASEIIEPPRISCGYRYTDRRGSIIPPADVFWVTSVARLVRLLNPPLRGWVSQTDWGGSTIPPAPGPLGIAASLASEIIEPPRQARPYMYSEGAVPERLNNPTRWRNQCGSRVYIDQRVRDCQAASRTSPVSSARSAFAAIQRSFKISFLTTRSDAACRRPSLHSGRSAS